MKRTTNPVNIQPHVFQSDKLIQLVKEAVVFFDTTPAKDLPPGDFSGAGVYALYYVGDFPLYHQYAEINRSEVVKPIYVGKAVPPGSRIGIVRSSSPSQKSLSGRLREHSASIEDAENIELQHFKCKFMILDGENGLSDLIVPVEAALIREHKPLWNIVLSGFGIHTPGIRRMSQYRSEWDTLHPGRTFAKKQTDNPLGLSAIIQKVETYLRQL